MDYQKEMFKELLKSFEIIENATFRVLPILYDQVGLMAAALADPEESRRIAESKRQVQFFSWIKRVAAALEVAGMTAELSLWNDATSNVPGSANDSSMTIQMTTLKAILIGFLEKLEHDGPSDALFPMELVEGTREYIEKIAEQTNGCYQRGWYDASAVMLRRLIETLIIECFEHHNISANIKDKDGNYFYLRDLISAFKRETVWHRPRNMGNNLDKLKTIGDSSAHSRYFVAKQSDLEKLSEAIRFTIQSLVYIAGFQ